MPNRVALLALFVSTLLSACASGPAFNDASAQFPPLRSDQGRIYFYRTSSLGAAIQPGVSLNGEKVGNAVPQGFFYVDRSPGNMEVVCSTEVENKLTFTLDKMQTRYVRLDPSLGFFVGHIVPRLIDPADGQKDIVETKYAPLKPEDGAATAAARQPGRGGSR